LCGAQRLDAEAAPTQLRDNLKIRCAFKTGSAETSKMILIYAHAFKLPAIPGRMMLWDMESGQYHKVQVPIIEKEQVAQLLAMHSRNREETKVFMNILKALAEVRKKDAEKKRRKVTQNK
jgi:DNA segregation ATPase FtsK/SpoIIIE-like protein